MMLVLLWRSRLTMCGAHDAIYELTAYRDPNLLPIKAFYKPCPKVSHYLLLRISAYGKEQSVWKPQKVLL